MVSKSSSTVSQRAVSGVENWVPATKSMKGSSQRRRTTRRTLFATPKYLVEQSQRKNDLTATTKQSKSKPAMQPSALSMADLNAQSPGSQPAGKQAPLRLPQELPRPQKLREVSDGAILAIDPTLAGIAPQYVREQLEDIGALMLNGMGGIKVSQASSSARAEVDVVVPTAGAVPPTHILAIYKNTTSSTVSFPTHSLLPVHSIFLAAHCANLPSLPTPPTTSSSASSSESITLPVQPIGLPSPETFAVLTSYLYHKRTETLLDQMFPLPAPRTLELNQLAETPVFGAEIARKFGATRVLKHMQLVYGLWLNACALGVVDDGLWDTIDLAWEVLLAALAASGRKSEASPAVAAL